mmetsp:Transcript_80029/g.212021  ORF Transcript_80029/g.212021 Transcript_80029/m.212021 type:complete len:209 (+) Transcript_80029:651-1277(+)
MTIKLNCVTKAMATPKACIMCEPWSTCLFAAPMWKISIASVIHPNQKAKMSSRCSLERIVSDMQTQPKVLGKPSSLSGFLHWHEQPLPLPTLSQPTVVRFLTAVSTVLPDMSASFFVPFGILAVMRVNAVLLLEIIFWSCSRCMLMKRTSVTRRRSRHRSAISAMVEHCSSCSSVTTIFGFCVGSMEHSSNTCSQLRQKRRNSAMSFS